MSKRIALTVAAGVLLSTVVGVLATPGTASAVPAITFVSASVGPDSGSPKIVTADCPPGTWVMGGTAAVIGGQGQVVIQSAFPIHNLGALKFQFVVKAEEDLTGTLDSWTLKAGAYCTSNVGVQYHTASSALDSNPIKEVQIECPDGMKVVGMGGQVSTGDQAPAPTVGDLPPASVVFNGMAVNQDLNTVTARATEEAGALGGSHAGSWAVSAVAACAFEFDVNGIEYRTQLKSAGQTESKSRVDFACTGAKKIISTGSIVDDSDMGQWYLHRSMRYNAFQQRMIGETYRNSELGTIPVRHFGYLICV